MALKGVAFKSGPNKDKHKSAVCAGLNSSGKNKGRLKKGFKWTGKACPVPAATTASASKKRKPAKKKSAKKTGPDKAKLCAGLHSSGKKKGKLKKGFKWKRGTKCPVTVRSK